MPTTPQPCRFPRCGAQVYYLTYPSTGKTAPIDVDPAPNGNVKVDLESGTYAIVPKDERAFHDDLHLNHWVTCESPVARERRARG